MVPLTIATLIWAGCGFIAWHHTMRKYVWPHASGYDYFMLGPSLIGGPIVLAIVVIAES